MENIGRPLTRAIPSLAEKIREIEVLNKEQTPNAPVNTASSSSESENKLKIRTGYELDLDCNSEELSEGRAGSEHSSDFPYDGAQTSASEILSSSKADSGSINSAVSNEGSLLTASYKIDVEAAQHFLLALQYICKEKNNIRAIRFLLSTIMYSAGLSMFEEANALLKKIGIDEIEVIQEYYGLAQNFKNAILVDSFSVGFQNPKLNKAFDSYEVIVRVMASFVCANYISKTKELLDQCDCSTKFSNLLLKTVKNYSEKNLDDLLGRVCPANACSACLKFKKLYLERLNREPNSMTQLIAVLVEWKNCTQEKTHQCLDTVVNRIYVLIEETEKIFNVNDFSFVGFHFSFKVDGGKLMKRSGVKGIPCLEMLLLIDYLDWDIIENPESLPVDFKERADLIKIIISILKKDLLNATFDSNTGSTSHTKKKSKRISNVKLKKHLNARNAVEFILNGPNESEEGDSEDHSDYELRDTEEENPVYEMYRKPVYFEEKPFSDELFDNPICDFHHDKPSTVSSDEELFDNPICDFHHDKPSTVHHLTIEDKLNLWIHKRLILRKTGPIMRITSTANSRPTGGTKCSANEPSTSHDIVGAVPLEQVNRALPETNQALLLKPAHRFKKRVIRTSKKNVYCPKDWKKGQALIVAKLAKQKREIMAFPIKVEPCTERDPCDDFADLDE